MLPFCGYNMGDYFGHWLKIGQTADPAKLPRIFYVNWFRKDASGKFLWPGFGENSRVLKWIVERLTATPRPRDPDRLPAGAGLAGPRRPDLSWADLALLLTVDTEVWKQEAAHIPEFFRTFHQHLPTRLWDLHQDLIDRLS